MTTLLNAVLLNALVAALLAILVWTAGMIPVIRRRPKLRHFLWVIVLLKLVTPPMFELSVLPAWFAAERLPTAHPRAVPLDEVVEISMAPAEAIHLDVPPVVTEAPAFDWMALLAAASGLGTLIILALAVRQTAKLRRALRRGESSDKRLNEIARGCAEQMRIANSPTVCVVSANVPPLLWIRRKSPLVVMPRRLVDEMSDEQLRCVICHEIAHYLRRDHWTNALSLMVAAVCWWHPVVWWARRELRTAQEACCDALVISRAVATRRIYAETLLHALEFIQSERSTLPALASGFGGKTSTRRRFEMIANVRVNHRLSWWSYPVLLAALAVLPLLPTFSRAQESDESPPGAGLSFFDYDGDGTIDVYVAGEAADARQTERRAYQVLRSERGWVVLAFDRRTGKLAWSSEIELARRDPNVPVPDGGTVTLGGTTVSGQRFLLHTGDGIVTIAVVEGEENLRLQEIDATTGRVTAECQLAGESQESVARKLLDMYFSQISELPLKELDDDERAALLEKLKVLNRRLHLDLEGVPEPADKASDPSLEHALQEAHRLLQAARQRAEQWGVYRKSCTACHDVATHQNREGVPLGSHLLAISTSAGNELVIEVQSPDGGKIEIEQAVQVWRMIHGDAPIEQINMTQKDGKMRMIIKGAVKTTPSEGTPDGEKGTESYGPDGYGDADAGGDSDTSAEGYVDLDIEYFRAQQQATEEAAPGSDEVFPNEN
jgi:beta-lactamase regulating signal transducer with metallopeptidase domain